MWPNKSKDNCITNETIENEVMKIYNKFGTTILSTWLNEIFDEKILALGGIEILLKISKCENCASYIGVNPIIKKMKKIYVISGFCSFYNSGIKKPEETTVCGFFDPNLIYKQIILMNIEEKIRNNKPSNGV